MHQNASARRSGFSLLEMVVVLGIISLLALMVILTLNPIQLVQQSRDARRVSDLATLDAAVTLYQSDQGLMPGYSIGSTTMNYISVPAANTNCSDLGLATSVYSYTCSGVTNYKTIAGAGWIPVNFQNIRGGAPFTSLAGDPVNQTSSDLYYTYSTDGSKYVITAFMESNKYATQVRSSGGVDPTLYEVGTGLSSLPISGRGLVGYWPLNEGSGSAIDWSGYVATGTWSGTTPYYATGHNQTYSGNFDGSDVIVAIPNTSQFQFGTGNFSVGAWVKTSASLSEAAAVAANRCGIAESWVLETYNNQASFSTFGTGSAGYLTSPGTVNDGKWHYLVGVRNGTSVAIYLDGVQANSAAVSAGYNSNSGASVITIGNLSSGGSCNHYWNGNIQDVRIYDRALSGAEIQQIYNMEK